MLQIRFLKSRLAAATSAGRAEALAMIPNDCRLKITDLLLEPGPSGAADVANILEHS